MGLLVCDQVKEEDAEKAIRALHDRFFGAESRE
jgi:aspartokinase